jgi:hypothetical protein
MATFDFLQNSLTNIGSASLSNGLLLKTGELPTNAGTISGTSGGTTTLCTVPTGRTYLVTGLILTITTATSLTGTATFSLGVNASTYDNIIPSTLATDWDDLNHVFEWYPEGAVWRVDAGQNIRINLTGVFGGTVTFEATLLGYIL